MKKNDTFKNYCRTSFSSFISIDEITANQSCKKKVKMRSATEVFPNHFSNYHRNI